MERAKAIAHVKDMYEHMIFREDKEALETLIPELKESEDERVMKWLIDYFKNVGNTWIHREISPEQILSYLEKQKNASYAIEAVERIDKYIDENLANAHDMKDSDPDKKYYLGWDDALGKMAGILQDVYSGDKQKEHQNNSDAPNESSWAGMISSSDKDKNLDEIAQDYVDSVKEYNPEPTWDLMQTAVCYGYHLGANHQVIDDEHLLSAIQVQFASHAKVENGKRYAKLTWDEFKKIVFELCSRGNQKEQKPAWSEKHIADVFEKVGLAMIAREQGNDALTNAIQSAMLELSKVENAEWSEDDEKILERFLGWLQGTMGEKTYSSWLKSLRERFNLQPNPAWSEEDEKKIIELKTFIARCNGFNKENRKKAFDMIDAIGPKPSWKPSEEQMGALSWMLENARGNIDFDSLKDLYKQLKKLM